MKFISSRRKKNITPASPRRVRPAFALRACYLLAACLIAGCTTFEDRGNLPINDVLKSLKGGTVVPQTANTILIPSFSDRSGRPTLADRLTLRIREIISQEGRLAVTTDVDNADLVLRGEVTRYELQPVAFNPMGAPVKNRVRITASVILLDKKGKREIFREREIQSFEVFSDLIPPLRSEAQTQDAVLENLARRIADKVLTGWYTDLMTPEEKGRK